MFCLVTSGGSREGTPMGHQRRRPGGEPPGAPTLKLYRHSGSRRRRAAIGRIRNGLAIAFSTSAVMLIAVFLPRDSSKRAQMGLSLHVSQMGFTQEDCKMRTAISRSYGLMTVLAGLMLTLAAPARAAIYMKYGTVNGDVTAKGYEKTIELSSFSLAVSRSVSSPVGFAGDRHTSAPSFSEVTLTAHASSASVPMFQEAVQGVGQDAIIYLTKTNRDSQITYAEWDLKNAIVSSFSTSGGGDIPLDTYTLSPTAYTYKWNNYDATGAQTGQVVYGYDLIKLQSTLVSSGDTTGFSFITAVPEPASLAGLLLAGPVLLMRRRM